MMRLIQRVAAWEEKTTRVVNAGTYIPRGWGRVCTEYITYRVRIAPIPLNYVWRLGRGVHIRLLTTWPWSKRRWWEQRQHDIRCAVIKEFTASMHEQVDRAVQEQLRVHLLARGIDPSAPLDKKASKG